MKLDIWSLSGTALIQSRNRGGLASDLVLNPLVVGDSLGIGHERGISSGLAALVAPTAPFATIGDVAIAREAM